MAVFLIHAPAGPPDRPPPGLLTRVQVNVGHLDAPIHEITTMHEGRSDQVFVQLALDLAFLDRPHVIELEESPLGKRVRLKFDPNL